MIELPIVMGDDKEYRQMEERIRAVFRRMVYFPLIEELGVSKTKVINATDNLLLAIQSGRITVSRGKWRGNFNVAISKELRTLGATWDGDHFTLPIAKAPADVRAAISISEVRFTEKLKRIDRKLARVVPAEVAEQIKTSDLFDTALWKIDKKLGKTLKDISVLPKLTDNARERLGDEWQNNMDLWITDFTEKEIARLRKSIQANVFKGNRYEDMISTIRKSYDVTKNKARFLARQETQLMMTKFKEIRYQEAGVNEYRWKCVTGTKLHPVRPSHKILEGKVFRFDDPPITDPSGRRNSPGQDYNCRCTSIPIVRFKK